jgi:ribonuclease HI
MNQEHRTRSIGAGSVSVAGFLPQRWNLRIRIPIAIPMPMYFGCGHRLRREVHDLFCLGFMKDVKIYTDGGCVDNPGPGGYGVVLLYDSHHKELSGGYRWTTNNRMEILAAIAGLGALKEPCRVTLYSDSQYLVNAIQKGWARTWQANGWRRSNRGKAINPDLWEKLLGLCKTHEVQFLWVRGHAGHSENERCDELAKAAARGSNLAIDEGYEKESPYKRRVLL